MLFSKPISGRRVSRQKVIALQIKHISEKIGSGAEIARVIDKGIIANQWVHKLEIQAYSEKEIVMGSFMIGVDWAAFTNNKKKFGSNVLVAIDKVKKKEHAIWSVTSAARTFHSFVKEHALQTRWLVYTEDGLNDRTTYKKMRIAKTKEFKWARGTKKVLFDESPKNLTEMTMLIETVR